jgi:hypothetical protein
MGLRVAVKDALAAPGPRATAPSGEPAEAPRSRPALELARALRAQQVEQAVSGLASRDAVREWAARVRELPKPWDGPMKGPIRRATA